MNEAAGRSFTIDNRKLTHYLLDPRHEDGGPKAHFFLRFGFSAADFDTLARALLAHARPERYVRTRTTIWGDRLIYEGPIQGPDGRISRVRTVWQINPDNPLEVTFLTAVPLGR